MGFISARVDFKQMWIEFKNVLTEKYIERYLVTNDKLLLIKVNKSNTKYK